MFGYFEKFKWAFVYSHRVRALKYQSIYRLGLDPFFVVKMMIQNILIYSLVYTDIKSG